MLFTQVPFSPQAGDLTPMHISTSPDRFIGLLATDYRAGNADGARRIDPLMLGGYYFSYPVDSELQRVQAPPKILPSGTR